LPGDTKLEKLGVVRSAGDVPPHVDAKSALVFDSPKQRRESLAQTKTPTGEGWGALITLGPNEAGRERRGDDRSERLHVLDGAAPRLRVRGSVREKIEHGDIASLDIGAAIERHEVEAYNVVGEIVGVRDEAIVVSAHYDHLGDSRGEKLAEAR